MDGCRSCCVSYRGLAYCSWPEKNSKGAHAACPQILDVVHLYTVLAHRRWHQAQQWYEAKRREALSKCCLPQEHQCGNRSSCQLQKFKSQTAATDRKRCHTHTDQIKVLGQARKRLIRPSLGPRRTLTPEGGSGDPLPPHSIS